MIMEDEKGEDSKILAVIENDPRTENIKDVKDVPKHKLDEILEFFKSYKSLDPDGWVKFKRWGDIGEAKLVIDKAISIYKETKSTE
jgi:inorganic pyrophosphatase